ncbi:MAG: hypothetical protein UW32_C0001G0114 [Candidatus Wolfebacteria bacterium GW2011_GWE2_44_13]|uniref:Uncharacterized protein n=1 Tax=Candidatus Wolfebacteria bacterium GW2011_GWE2_44_13 TaxID=1619017 RepID=A0A0G1JHN6_9BACT|nr:MAG: hypothetical protein UW32_C0001G0114 [Candidatus Wolfebacteria bacterium GW2011_GWE2_44_13]
MKEYCLRSGNGFPPQFTLNLSNGQECQCKKMAPVLGAIMYSLVSISILQEKENGNGNDQQKAGSHPRSGNGPMFRNKPTTE